MNKILLAAVSTLALMSAMPATAADPAQNTTQEATPKTSGYNDTSNTKQESLSTKDVAINPKQAAANIIGQPVYSETGETVAKVTDIIIDKSGNTELVILGDGDFTGWGKAVAYDYDIVANQTAEGNIVAPLTEEMIAKAENFSYDADDADENTRAIPTDSYSVAELLDSQVVDTSGDTLAQVDNLAFKDGNLTHVIIGFDKTLGMGGNHAALAFNDIKLVTVNDDVDFQLSSQQASQLDAFIKASAEK